MARRFLACPCEPNGDEVFQDLNKKLLGHFIGNMDNWLFILFAPERATSAPHTTEKVFPDLKSVH